MLNWIFIKFIVILPFMGLIASYSFSETISLQKPDTKGIVPFEQTLFQRRSVRTYKNIPLTLKEVSQLLWACNGITAASKYRTAPSAGALYPLEIYLCVNNVTGLNKGVYKYFPKEHALKIVSDNKNISFDLANSALGQSSISEAAINIVISGVSNRITSKYGNRGIRYMFMEAGHASQNVYLQCQTLNLGTVAIGAFNDKEIKTLLKMPADEEPLYIMPVGKI